MTQRQFRDGDVITVFLRTWNRVDGLCGDVSDSASDDYSGSEDAPVELHVVTLFQSGSDGDDQRFDILVPWHETGECYIAVVHCQPSGWLGYPLSIVSQDALATPATSVRPCLDRFD